MEINALLWIGCTGTMSVESVKAPLFNRHSPLLHDDDDGPQQQDEDHQAPGAGPQDQTHVLGMLGNLQCSLRVLTGSCRESNERRGIRYLTTTVNVLYDATTKCNVSDVM